MLPIGTSQLVVSKQWPLELKERKRFDPLCSSYTEQVDYLCSGRKHVFPAFLRGGAVNLGASDVNGFNILEKSCP